VFWDTEWRIKLNDEVESMHVVYTAYSGRRFALLMLLCIDVIHTPGQVIGRLFIHVFGFHNNETAALTYEDLYVMYPKQILYSYLGFIVEDRYLQKRFHTALTSFFS